MKKSENLDMVKKQLNININNDYIISEILNLLENYSYSTDKFDFDNFIKENEEHKNFIINNKKYIIEIIKLNYIQELFNSPKYQEKLKCFMCNSEYNIRICSRCKKTCYCSNECQKKDWNRHKSECKR